MGDGMQRLRCEGESNALVGAFSTGMFGKGLGSVCSVGEARLGGYEDLVDVYGAVD